MIIARNHKPEFWLDFSRLFSLPCQRQRYQMILDVLVQFLVEFVRSLIVDELTGRVRGRVSRLAVRSGSRNVQHAILKVHRRNRERLLNKLFTDITGDL
jgi:hypothetical protein